MAKAESFEYRGYHIDRVESPSKNHRIGNILTFWEVRELRRLSPSRPEARRLVDREIKRGQA